MMRGVFVTLTLPFFTASALAFPPKWQRTYCRSYADNAVAVNKASIKAGCNAKLKNLVSADAWSSNWHGHQQWCLSQSNIAEAERQNRIRREDWLAWCPGRYPLSPR